MPVEAYSALVSSSHLTHLDVSMCCVPVGTVPYMFRQDGQLTALKVLRNGLTELMYDEPYCLGPGDLELIVGCCPGLEVLFLCPAVQQDVQLSALQQLSNLARLSLGGPAPNDEAVTAVILQLTRLQHLHLVQAENLGPRGLVSLAQLTHLTSLRVEQCGPIGKIRRGYCYERWFECELVSEVRQAKTRSRPAAPPATPRHNKYAV